MDTTKFTEAPKWLIWGKEGWIAGKLYMQLSQERHAVSMTNVRMEQREAVMAVLKQLQPTHVLLCAGITGRPNVDWCESHKAETVRSNVIGTLNVVDCCYDLNIHCTVFATGCIYQYDDLHPLGSGTGFKETDPPNFTGSFYSFTKSHTEALLQTYPNTLILRLRMPVSDDLHPRSFLTKITQYERVVDIPNSHTVLHDLLPCALMLATHNETGTYNFTNPGAISHNEVLALYKSNIKPGFEWKNFTIEEQAQVIKAPRSNCELDSSKLVAKMAEYGVAVPEVHEAYEALFARMKGLQPLGNQGV